MKKAPVPIPSIPLLEAGLADFFRKKGIDRFESVHLFPNPHRGRPRWATDLVLYGEAPLQLLISLLALDLTKTYRLWVLSHRTKRLMMRLFDFEAPQIGVVPRYELFPVRRETKGYEAKKRETPGRQTAWVYAGRDVPGKNLDLLVSWHRSLRRKKTVPDLHWVGPRSDVGAWSSTSATGSGSYYLGDYGVDWAKRFDPSALFVSFSTYPSEDFSVSAAQAEGRGMRVLAPDWNGLGDLAGPRTHLFPARWVGDLRSGRLSFSEFTDRVFALMSGPAPARPQEAFEMPELISSKDVVRKSFGVPATRLQLIFDYYNKEKTDPFKRKYSFITEILEGRR